MKNIESILSLKNTTDIINSLKIRENCLPNYITLISEYDPYLHRIAHDTVRRKDKIHEDGTKEVAARICLPFEQLITKRMTEFMFATPVIRTYTNIDTAARKDIANAIEAIYTKSFIDAENNRRATGYFAFCEALTIWYTKKESNNFYGFHSDYKLKCKSFSPSHNVAFFPLFDEIGDLKAISLEYTYENTGERTTFFETFTADKHLRWRKDGEENWENDINLEGLMINKIPCIYLSRHQPIWVGTTHLREEMEYKMSEASDVISYNSAPVLMVVGGLEGEENKGESKRVYRCDVGGNVQYVSWNQSTEFQQSYLHEIKSLIFAISQMPDMSFENMKSLGNIGYDSRKTLFADAHLKVLDESYTWITAFDREVKVIKAFLKLMNKEWNPDDIDAVEVHHKITPYMPENETELIDRWTKANGGKPLVSHLDSIKGAHLTTSPVTTYEGIVEDEKRTAKLQANQFNMFSAE